MLSDPYVLTVPDWFRPILVNGIILLLRQFSSAAHYRMMWDHKRNISPLLYHTHLLAEKLQVYTHFPVGIAMRYGQPDISSAIERLAENNELEELIVLPLFPQYADSSYKTVVEELKKQYNKKAYSFRLKIVPPYFSHPAYIDALANSISPYLKEKFDKLIISFHSLPLSHIEKGRKTGEAFDYHFQVEETVRLLTKELNFDNDVVELVYSSAMGSDWLKPYLNRTVVKLAQQGATKVIVVCPGFAVDNLETLYDIDIKAKKLFLKHGGTQLTFVPCLNSDDYWVEAVSKIILQ